MRLDYIEIGACDFDTLIDVRDDYGITIEPLDFYLNRLPNKSNNIKLNVAISEQDGFCDIFYIDPIDIEKHNLPLWLRGCNSIIKEHQSVLNILKEKDLLKIYKKKTVETICWDTLIKKFNIHYVDFLKIDTEGFDCKIVQYILNSSTNLLPKKIKFKINILTKTTEIEKTVNLLKFKGYSIINKNKENIEVFLNNKLPDKIIFSSNDSQYLNFWKHNSEICSKILNITPVLLHITEEESDFFWDEFGLIKKIKKNEDLQNLSQVVRLYSGVLFPDDYLILSDIDMFLFDKRFLINKLKNHQDFDVTIIGSDAYDKRRYECSVEINKMVQYVGIEERFPMCYIILKGNILNKIMNIDEKCTLNDMYKINSFNNGWDSDELNFSKNVIEKNFKINKINRGYQSYYFLKDRIEKKMFDKSFWLSLKDLESMEYFIDCHCPNYDEFEETILYIKDLILSRN